MNRYLYFKCLKRKSLDFEKVGSSIKSIRILRKNAPFFIPQTFIIYKASILLSRLPCHAPLYIEFFGIFPAPLLCHVIVLVITKYIQSPVSPSSYLSFRLKLMFCGLLGTIHGCVSGLVFTHMHKCSLLLSISPCHSHIPSGKFTMHHICHPGSIPCIMISITTFFTSVKLHWVGFEPMTFPSKGQAANHLTTGVLMKVELLS